jgi:hypothetical protein
LPACNFVTFLPALTSSLHFPVAVFESLVSQPETKDDGYVKPTYKTIYPQDFEIVADAEEHMMITRGKSGTKPTKKKALPINPPTKKRKITPEKSVAGSWDSEILFSAFWSDLSPSSVYRGRVLEDRRSARIAKKKGRHTTRRPVATVATRANRKVSLTSTEFDSGDDSGASDGSGEDYEDEDDEPAGGKKRKKTPAKRAPAAANRQPARSRSPKRKPPASKDDSASISSAASSLASTVSSAASVHSAPKPPPPAIVSDDTDDEYLKGDKDDEEDWQNPDETKQEKRRKPAGRKWKKKSKLSRRRLSSVDVPPVKMRRKRYYTTEETKKCAVCMRAATSMPRIPCTQCCKPVCPMCRSKDEQPICPTCWVDNTRSTEVLDRLKARSNVRDRARFSSIFF